MAKRSKTTIRGKMDENGELHEFEYNNTFDWGEEPPYVKVYFQDILYLQDVSKKYLGVMYALLKRVSYAGDENPLCVTINKGTKKNICKEIGWKNPVSIDNAIQVLMKGGIIRRVERGMYQFNPYFFGRGNWADISKVRMSVDYDAHGRRFEAKFDGDDKVDDEEFWKMINQEA